MAVALLVCAASAVTTRPVNVSGSSSACTWVVSVVAAGTCSWATTTPWPWVTAANRVTCAPRTTFCVDREGAEHPACGAFVDPGAQQPVGMFGVDGADQATHGGAAGRHVPPGGAVEPGACQRQHRLRKVSGLVTDLSEVRGAAEHGQHRHRQDADQPVTDTPRISWIGYTFQDLQQRPESGDVQGAGMRR